MPGPLPRPTWAPGKGFRARGTFPRRPGSRDRGAVERFSDCFPRRRGPPTWASGKGFRVPFHVAAAVPNLSPSPRSKQTFPRRQSAPKPFHVAEIKTNLSTSPRFPKTFPRHRGPAKYLGDGERFTAKIQTFPRRAMRTSRRRGKVHQKTFPRRHDGAWLDEERFETFPRRHDAATGNGWDKNRGAVERFSPRRRGKVSGGCPKNLSTSPRCARGPRADLPPSSCGRSTSRPSPRRSTPASGHCHAR